MRRRATTCASSGCCWPAGRSTGRGSCGPSRWTPPSAIRSASSNPASIQTADPANSADFHAGPGQKFGLGLLLNRHARPGLSAADSGAWAGMFNTHFWIDRASGVTGALYAQTLPFVEPAVLALYEDFERALYASL